MSNKTKINRMKRTAVVVVFATLLMMLTGCTFKQNVYPIYTGTPTPKPTSTNTPEPTAVPTDTPLPTATTVPTETPIPTPIVTPTETPTPVPTEIPHEHAYVCVDRVESTCKIEGYELYECRSQNGTCDAPTKREILPLSREHVFDEWEVVKKETDEEEGLKQRRCAVCGLVEEEKIPVHEHEFEKTVKNISLTCAYCGEEYVVQTIVTRTCECGYTDKKDEIFPHHCNCAEVSGKVYITGSVAVRKYPNADSEKLGSLTEGKAVTCECMYVPNGWYRVEYKSGKYGWVSGKYVSLSDPKAPAGAATPTPPITYTKLRRYTEADRPFQPGCSITFRLIEASPLYEKPDTESMVKNETIYPVGTVVQAAEMTSNGFYYVTYGRTLAEKVVGYVPVSCCGEHCADEDHRFTYVAETDRIECEYCGEHLLSNNPKRLVTYTSIKSVSPICPVFEVCEACDEEYLFGYMISFVDNDGKTWYSCPTFDDPLMFFEDFVSSEEISAALKHYSGKCK